METKIHKWGNSLAVRLPKAFADQAGIENGSNVLLKVEDGKILVVPVTDKESLLDSMLSRINESNIHEEVDFGDAVGRECL